MAMPSLKKENLSWILGITSVLLMLYLPTLWVGFLLDDHLILEKIQAVDQPLLQRILQSYQFVTSSQVKEAIAQGILPWWSSPHLNIEFFRPLTGLSFVFDHWIFQKNAMGYHLDSLCWWFLAILIWSQILKSISHRPIYWLSLFLLICSQVYFLPVLWIANRHALLALVFILSSIYAYQHKALGYRYSIAALFFFTCALLSSEWSVGGIVYLILYACFFESNTHRKTMVSLLPFLIILFVYLIFYRYFGYGARESGLYLNPLQEPLTYLYTLGLRLPDFILMLFTSRNEAANRLFQSYDSVWIFKCIVVIFIILLSIACIRRYPPPVRRALYWLGSSALLSCLPFTTSVAQARLLVFPMLGGSVITAAVLWIPWMESSYKPLLKQCLKGMVILYFIQRFLLVPMNLWFSTYGYFIIHQKLTAFSKELAVSKHSSYKITTVAPYTVSPLFINNVRRFAELPTIEPWYLLVMSDSDASIQTLSSKTLQITDVQDGLFNDPHAFIFRSLPFHLNDSIKTPAFTATITNMKEGIPTQIVFQLNDLIRSEDFIEIK